MNFVEVRVGRATSTFGVAFCTFRAAFSASLASRRWLGCAVSGMLSVLLYGGHDCLLQFVSVLGTRYILSSPMLVLAQPSPEVTFVHFIVFSVHDVCENIGHSHCTHLIAILPPPMYSSPLDT